MEAEQSQKTAVVDEQQRRNRQRREQKLQQEHDQDISNANFQAEFNQQRQLWQFQKEQDAYDDRRKQRLDGNSSKAADDKSAELFRRERFLAQTSYDWTIHSATRINLEQRHSGEYAYQDSYKEDAYKDVDADTGDRSGDRSDDEGQDDNKEMPTFNPCG